jgi:hypothetical protein
MLASVVKLTGAITVDVSDSFSTRTVTLVSGGATRYARVFLADVSDAGTSASAPYDVLTELEAALNAAPGSSLWMVRLSSLGAVRITYSGTGTATLTWSGTDLRNLLGFAGDLTIPTGTSNTATYAPGGCIVATAADEQDSGWQPVGAGLEANETRGGKTISVGSFARKLTRTLTLRLLPLTLAEQTSGERLTPAFPEDTVANSSRYSTPSATAFYNAAFSAHEFIGCVHRIPSAPAAFAIGDLQTLVAGTSTTYDTGYVSAETLRGGELFPLSVPGWYARRDLVLRLNREARDER